MLENTKQIDLRYSAKQPQEPEVLASTATQYSEASATRPKPKLGVVASRDEMNLAEFPLAVLSTRSNPNIKTLEFSDTQRLKTGEIVERKWIITGADKFGLPTSTDDDVVLGLMRLSMDGGFRERKVYFTRYELLKILRWSTEGRSYSRLTKSLDRLSGVRIRATNAFFDNTAKGYKTRNFGLIDAYEINDGRGTGKQQSGSEPPKSYFIWSEALFDSFKAGFIKKLDLDLYFTLRSAVSRRLYRYLDKHFYYKRTVEKPLMIFAFEKLGLSRNYKYVSSIKQQIEPAAEELVKIGFLESFEFNGRGQDASVRFVKALEAVEHQEGEPRTITRSKPSANVAQTLETLSEAERRVVEMVAARGIAERQALKLVQGRGAAVLAHMNRIVRYFDSLVATNDRKISKNPVGFLYRAIEKPEKFQLPKVFNAPDAHPVAKRPELRVVSSEKRGAGSTGPGANLDERKRAYRLWVAEEVESVRSELSKSELVTIENAIEDKMRCLKDILEASKYREALDGCVREELIRRAGIPKFEVWAKD